MEIESAAARRKSRSVHFLSEPDLIAKIERRTVENDRSPGSEIRSVLRASLKTTSSRRGNG